MAFDWQAMQASYVEGTALDPDGDPGRRNWPTLAEVAETFGASHDRVRKRAAAAHWTELRERFQGEMDDARRRLLVEQRAGAAAGIDRRAMSAAEAGLALIGQRLTYLVTTETAKSRQAPADVGKTVSATELANLGLAAKRWVQVKGEVMGQPAPEELADEAALERDLRVGESLLAARLAEHVAARALDVDEDLPA